MTPASDWETAALTALGTSPPSSARRLFKMAWIAALLGFVLLILSDVLSFFFFERVFDHSYDIRDISWLSSISSISSLIGIALMVACIIFMIRGLLIENSLQHSGTILLGTLRSLEWVAMIALALYLTYLPLSLLGMVFESPFLLALSYSNPAFLCLWALPVIVAHALNKPRA